MSYEEKINAFEYDFDPNKTKLSIHSHMRLLRCDRFVAGGLLLRCQALDVFEGFSYMLRLLILI
jgi:deferrochelatase/peroxidase EfeB